MKEFSFTRFTALLVRVLEICIITSFTLRWFDATVGFWYRITLSRVVYDVAMNFSLLALLLLLLITLLLLFTHQPRASTLAIRAAVYIVVFCLSPFRLANSALNTTQRPNHTMQRTAGSLGSSLTMKVHPQPAAARSLASRR
jgi:hypothetical protein